MLVLVTTKKEVFFHRFLKELLTSGKYVSQAVPYRTDKSRTSEGESTNRLLDDLEEKLAPSLARLKKCVRLFSITTIFDELSLRNTLLVGGLFFYVNKKL